MEIDILNQIFSTLDGIFETDDTDGIAVLGSLLSLSDESFNVIKPALMGSIEQAFNDPEAHIALVQMMNEKGVKVEDFSKSFDSLIEAIDQLIPEGIELTETKKDFLKYMFASFINSMNSVEGVPHRIL